VADAVGRTVGDPGDHHTAIAVSDRDGIAQILLVQHGDGVVDVAVEVDIGLEQMGPLSQAGKCRGVDLVSIASQNENESRHRG
jgi:hypothetical protein